MRLARLILYPGLFLVAAIGMLPGAIFIGMLALIVPGLILIAAPTVALYAPFIDLLVIGLLTRRPVLWLPGLFALALIAAALPMGSRQALDSEIAAATANDFQRDPGGTPKRLLLHDYRRTQGSPGGNYAGRWIYSSVEGGGCDETCARLLISRQLEAIIRPIGKGLTAVPSLESGYAGAARVYTYEPAANCPAADRNSLTVEPDTLALIGSGHCIIMREVAAPAFDAAVTTLSDSYDSGRLDPSDPGLSAITRMTLWRCAQGRCATTAIRTSVAAERMGVPLAIGIESHADMHMRRAFWRTPTTVNPRIRDDWTMARLGLRKAALPAADPARLRQSAESALAIASAEHRPLTNAEQEAVARTLKTIAERPDAPTADDLALLRTIVLHPTADWLSNFSEVFRKHPEAGIQLAEALIAGFAQTASGDEPQRQNDLRRALARAIADLPPGSFADQGPALLKAAAIPGALKDAQTLLARLGDLGSPALPLLTAALAERGDEEAAAYGLCRVGPAAASAAPALVALQATGGNWNRDRGRVFALALARMGRPDLIRRPAPETYENVSPAGKRYDDAWFDAVPPTISPASPPEVCSEETTRNRTARQRRSESR